MGRAGAAVFHGRLRTLPDLWHDLVPPDLLPVLAPLTDQPIACSYGLYVPLHAASSSCSEQHVGLET